MTTPRWNDLPDRVRNAEETLRLMVTAPAPQGLAERVQARLDAAPRRPFWMSWNGPGLNGWMFNPVLRGCAAAAIVMVVAGGGWSIYARVQPPSSANNMPVPARIGPNGGFSNAGAMRTPSTLNGPVLAHPAIPAQENVVAPMASPKPGALTTRSKPATHKKQAAANPVR
ncbi:MAG TPA: hypothetical protein VGL22_06540 [Terracidiphilus sp.]